MVTISPMEFTITIEGVSVFITVKHSGCNGEKGILNYSAFIDRYIPTLVGSMVYYPSRRGYPNIDLDKLISKISKYVDEEVYEKKRGEIDAISLLREKLNK